MPWNIEDYVGFIESSENGVGQITPESDIGKKIIDIVSNESIKSILEIGTWNGMGSTKCIVEGLNKRKDTNYVFYSLEANSDKSDFAKQLYSDMPNVHILNEVVYNGPQDDASSIFCDLYTDNNNTFWNTIDLENIKGKPLFLERNDIPYTFDVVLLDGGVFTTWYEYLLLKDRCKILILDDVNIAKCKRISDDIKAHPEKWEIIDETNMRNGNMIARNKML